MNIGSFLATIGGVYVLSIVLAIFGSEYGKFMLVFIPALLVFLIVASVASALMKRKS